MKPKLMDGTYTAEGTIGLIYADEVADLSDSEYIGVDKSQLVSGSLAYDRNQNIYCYDGEMWNKKDGTVILNEYQLTTIGTQGKGVTVTTEQYLTYDFGGWIFTSTQINEDPTQWGKAHIYFDGKWYDLDRKSFTWGVNVPYFGADPSGTYPALSFDFSEYPFAIANMNGDVALIVPSNPNLPSQYVQVHTIYGYANWND